MGQIFKIMLLTSLGLKVHVSSCFLFNSTARRSISIIQKTVINKLVKLILTLISMIDPGLVPLRHSVWFRRNTSLLPFEVGLWLEGALIFNFRLFKLFSFLLSNYLFFLSIDMVLIEIIESLDRACLQICGL